MTSFASQLLRARAGLTSGGTSSSPGSLGTPPQRTSVQIVPLVAPVAPRKSPWTPPGAYRYNKRAHRRADRFNRRLERRVNRRMKHGRKKAALRAVRRGEKRAAKRQKHMQKRQKALVRGRPRASIVERARLHQLGLKPSIENAYKLRSGQLDRRKRRRLPPQAVM